MIFSDLPETKVRRVEEEEFSKHSLHQPGKPDGKPSMLPRDELGAYFIKDEISPLRNAAYCFGRDDSSGASGPWLRSGQLVIF